MAVIRRYGNIFLMVLNLFSGIKWMAARIIYEMESNPVTIRLPGFSLIIANE